MDGLSKQKTQQHDSLFDAWSYTKATLLWIKKTSLFGLILSAFFTAAPTLSAQVGSPKENKQQADFLFENGKYKNALPYYIKYLESANNDGETLLQTAICLYHSNQNHQAQRYLTSLVGQKRIDPKAYLFLAKTYHADLQFKEAITNYKRYLAHSKGSNTDRKSIRDAIKRCANGLKIEHDESFALSENLGEKVNSENDDFAPVISPNYANKLYFSSARSSSIGGLRDSEGHRNTTAGIYSSDMYFTSVFNGEWTATTPMSGLLNTSRNDIVLDFNADGSILFFFKGYNQFSGEIFTDTFGLEQDRDYPPTLVSSMLAEQGDGRPDFFKDSIIIFDSRRAGGFGGSDLYWTVKRGATWTKPQNLGPQINSAYDETTPFLAADGHTLFFSSNDSRRSLGGMDIFKATYNQEKQRWSKASNMGLSINSSRDDLFFSVSKDGLQAYFSSNRKESIGDNDIFVAYFKEQLAAQTPASEAPFSFIEKQTLIEEELVSDNTATDKTTLQTYELEALYYKDDRDVLSPNNITRLNSLITLLQEHPSLKALLSCHSDESDASQFDLFFAIKRAEKAADYLIENGIGSNRIFLRGVGSTYPIAKSILDGEPNKMGQQLNRRIDLTVLNTKPSSIDIVQKEPQVSQFMVERKGQDFLNTTNGLTYKIQVSALKQMYKGELLKEYKDPLIERDASRPFYNYSVGLFQSFAAAKQLQNELIIKGFTEVFVVAYVGGRRISKDAALNYTAIYPDLVNFIAN